MEYTADDLLSLLRNHEATNWVAEQVVQSFAQGVSMNVKDASSDARFSALEPSGLTKREKQKRQKYETTRPYLETEKVELILRALKILFVELPAIQVAGMVDLQQLGSEATVIEFVPPDELEQSRSEYSKSAGRVKDERGVLESNFAKFVAQLSS
jgi:hypothetical protein